MKQCPSKESAALHKDCIVVEKRSISFSGKNVRKLEKDVIISSLSYHKG